MVVQPTPSSIPQRLVSHSAPFAFSSCYACIGATRPSYYSPGSSVRSLLVRVSRDLCRIERSGGWLAGWRESFPLDRAFSLSTGGVSFFHTQHRIDGICRATAGSFPSNLLSAVMKRKLVFVNVT